MKKPILVATLGYPGSGKTYFSERLSKEFNFFHISYDKIRSEMFENPTYKPEEHRAVFNVIFWLTLELLKKGTSVIVDANANKPINRNKLLKLATKAKTGFIIVHIKTPVEVAEKRILKRRNLKNLERKKYYKHIEISVLHSEKAEIEYPTKREKVLEIDGLKSYKEQVKVFKKWFNSR